MKAYYVEQEPRQFSSLAVGQVFKRYDWLFYKASDTRAFCTRACELIQVNGLVTPLRIMAFGPSYFTDVKSGQSFTYNGIRYVKIDDHRALGNKLITFKNETVTNVQYLEFSRVT